MLTTIYRARQIHTMDPDRPAATHVAVRDARILGAGTLDELSGWGDYRLDDRFADKVLMPGLVEGHSHLMEGSLWRYVYCGFHDRMSPDGRIWPGLPSIDAVIERLCNEQARLDDPSTALIGWGFDPIYFGGRRCNRHDLDRVSIDRPVVVWHASLHIVNANSAALARADYLRPGLDSGMLPPAADGLPIGEVRSPESMTPLLMKLGVDFGNLTSGQATLQLFSRMCVRKGVTTATDLVNPLPAAAVDGMLKVTSDESFATRIVSLLRFGTLPVAQLIERAIELTGQSSDRLRLGGIKIVADGSIQGFSARLRWPGYFNGAPNGLWYAAPEQIRQALTLMNRHRLQAHIHTNGDEATAMVLDQMQAALQSEPAFDHRHTLQHCQLADAAQFRRIKALGMCVNLFANHLYYWGDAHYEQTVGPERAERMNACATALRVGVPLAIHSDAPVTPLGPLFTAWCAVNRRSSGGRLLGALECITVAQALRAITLGAAYTLKLDGEIGSIECGKRADFAVLEDDPLEIAPDQLKDVRIWGVVSGGVPHAAG